MHGSRATADGADAAPADGGSAGGGFAGGGFGSGGPAGGGPAGGGAVGGEPLAVRLPNWVGDVCMALPALRALQSAGFAPTLFGRRWAADLLAAHRWPVVALPGPVRDAAARLRTTGIRHGLLLTNSLSSALAFRLGGIAPVGYRHDGRSLLLARGVARPTGVHEVECFWRIARACADWRGRGDGWPASPPDGLGLRVDAAQRDAARAALDSVGLAPDEPCVVLAPLAVGTAGGTSKVWPGFGELARRLDARGVAVVCCPGPGEEDAARASVPQAAMLPGLGLGAYAAVCASARVTVANDSGPMHVAAAVGAEVVGVFGPTDPGRTRPWGPHARWLGGAGAWPSVEAVASAVQVSLERSPAREGSELL